MLPWEEQSGMRRARFSTDVAMLGAWDASHQVPPIDASSEERHRIVEEDARAALLFFADTRADCGGLVGVFVDEPIPEALARYFTPIPATCRLAVPTGALVIDGVEHYRAAEAECDPSIQVSPGDYGVSILLATRVAADMDDEVERVVRERVGATAVELHDRANLWLLGVSLIAGIAGCAGLLWIGVMPILAFFVGALLVLGTAHPIQWALERSPQHRALSHTLMAHRLQLEPPIFLLRLERLDPEDGLTGGFVDLAATPEGWTGAPDRA